VVGRYDRFDWLMVKVLAIRAVLTMVLLAAVMLGSLWLVQRRLIYFPDRSSVPPAATVLAGGRDIELATVDGLRLRGWLVAPSAPQRGMAVLVVPGNAGNRLHRAPLARALADAGFSVLVMDYRGYGGNPGHPGEPGLARDVRAAREYLAVTVGIPPRRMIYYGESLGAAVVAELAVTYPPAGLVLRSPFADLAAVGRYHYPMLPVRALLRDRYPVADLVDRITAPTVVVYGTADTVVPPEQSRMVAARAAGPARLVAVAGADHNDAALVDGPAVVDAVVEVADRIGA
jgi:alpha-beta hydrolase superfamily lysophospholipase